MARILRIILWLVLVLYGLALGFVAARDLIFADGMGAKLAAGWLGLAATVIILGRIASFPDSNDQQGPRIYAGLAADLVTLLAGAMLILRIWTNFAPQPRLLTTGAVVALVVVAALGQTGLDLWRAGTRSRRQELQQRDVGAARSPAAPGPSAKESLVAGALGAAATVMAALLALPQFWYTAHYQPSTTVPVVTVSNGIKRTGDDGGGPLRLQATIRVENTGKTAVRILASMYQVTGTKVTARQTPAPLDIYELSTAVEENYGPTFRFNRYTRYASPELIQTGPVTLDRVWIGPGESTRATLVVHAPRERFELVRLTTDFSYARADRVDVDEGTLSPSLTTCDRTKIVKISGRLTHDGWLDSLTESDRELVTLWAFSGKHGNDSRWWSRFPRIRASLQQVDHPCEHALNSGDQGLEERAMVGETGAVAETDVRD